ncbi:MAG: DUF4836 family protein [Chitinophagaceae bacterium]|nr:DUF4836 family protein [Chitinophagaceae bacterium]
MIRTHRLLIFICLLFVAFTACNKIPKHAKYIPKDSQMVLAIDLDKMGKKLIWNAVTGSELFKDMMKNLKNESSKNAAKDISSIGLKQNSSVFVFSNRLENGQASVCILAGMENAKTFEDFIVKNYPNQAIDKLEGYKSCTIESMVVAAWNDDAALFFPLQQMNTTATDSLGMGISMKSEAEIKSQLKSFFSLKDENSIESNAHFKSLLDDHHDISLWLNYQQILEKNMTAGSNPFMKKDYFKDAALASGYDFEKGNIEANMAYYMSKEMADIYKKSAGNKLDMDMIKQLPGKDVMMVMGMQLKVEMIRDFLKLFGLDGLANMGLGLAGTSLDQIQKAFKGDIVFAVSDVNMKDSSSNLQGGIAGLTDMQVFCGMRVGDKQAMQDLMNIGVKNKLLNKMGDRYVMADGGPMTDIVCTDKYLAFSNQPNSVNSFLEGKNDIRKNLPAGVWDKLSSNPFVFYMDIKKLTKVIPIEADNAQEQALLNKAKNLINYVEMHGGQMKKGAVITDGNLRFANESENALIQLLDLAVEAKKLKDIKDKEAPTEPVIDSAFIQ